MVRVVTVLQVIHIFLQVRTWPSFTQRLHPQLRDREGISKPRLQELSCLPIPLGWFKHAAALDGAGGVPGA